MNIDRNKRNVFKISLLDAVILLVALCVSSVGLRAAEETISVAEIAELDQQLDAYRAQIEDLEFEFNPYHSSLIEPLESMVLLLREKGDYEQVAEIQNRQLQVLRTELGFEHPDIIPLLKSIISNEMLLGNWENISDHLEHIRHLQASLESDDPNLLLGAIDDQINWIFSRIALEDSDDLVRNFFNTRGLYDDMKDLLEDKYGKENPESAPWLYKVAYNSFHLVQFLNGSKGVGSRSVDRLVRQEGAMKLQSSNRNSFGASAFYSNRSRIPVVDADRPVGDTYLRDGYFLVRKIHDMLEEQDDIEAFAMAKIYRGDYQLLSGRGSAIRTYREARELLLEAGVAEDDVNWFFERPMVIPMDTFHTRLADAIADLKERIPLVEPESKNELHLGVFTAWLEALDSTPMPLSKDPYWKLELPYHYVDLSFSVSSRGKASSVDVLASGPDDEEVGRNTRRSVREIHFRPAIIDGKAKRVNDVFIRYRFVQE